MGQTCASKSSSKMARGKYPLAKRKLVPARLKRSLSPETTRPILVRHGASTWVDGSGSMLGNREGVDYEILTSRQPK
jgi:hypothetical protein